MRATLARIARAADEAGFAVRHKLKLLRNHWREVGRPFDEIERTAIELMKNEIIPAVAEF